MTPAALALLVTSISGPHTHDNLSIFLIHGRNQTSRPFLTLEEALAQRKIVVYETKNVNELAIENVSLDQEVYIQSGEIVKGGQQDRTITDDLIVPPKSGRLPLAAFCVEHGRWTRRGTESAARFDAAPAAVSSKKLKMAIRSANQSEVWEKVAEVQTRLSSAMNLSVASPASPSSLQLTLENERVQKSADAYVHALAGILNGKSDVIGYAFAINGKVNSADVYASSELFRKLWPKMLKASAVEALAEAPAKFEPAKVKVEDVKAMLNDTGAAKSSVRDVTGRIRIKSRETATTAVYETEDRAMPIHSSFIRR